MCHRLYPASEADKILRQIRMQHTWLMVNGDTKRKINVQRTGF